MTRIKRLSKNELVELARIHTEEMESKYEVEIVESSQASKIYKPDFEPKFCTKEYGYEEISVSDKDVVTAIFDVNHGHVPAISTIRWFTDPKPIVRINNSVPCGGKIAVLNFASFKNPGGRFLGGSLAQEEALCHASFLYNVLERHMDDFYIPHKKELNKGLYTSEILYSPNVRFFKSWEFEDETLSETRLVNVITCAAPFTKTYLKYNKLEYPDIIRDTLKHRINSVLNVAIDNEIDTLILGAFGCGVFGNDPNLVSEIFYDCLFKEFEGNFKNVIFPIPKDKTNNYEVFADRLKRIE